MEISIQHIFREGNRVTDILAKQGASKGSGFYEDVSSLPLKAFSTLAA